MRVTDNTAAPAAEERKVTGDITLAPTVNSRRSNKAVKPMSKCCLILCRVGEEWVGRGQGQCLGQLNGDTSSSNLLPVIKLRGWVWVTGFYWTTSPSQHQSCSCFSMLLLLPSSPSLLLACPPWLRPRNDQQIYRTHTKESPIGTFTPYGSWSLNEKCPPWAHGTEHLVPSVWVVVFGKIIKL